MDVHTAIQNRYSCRNYSSRPVERERLDAIMRAAVESPSACNKQPWRYYVIQDSKLLGSFKKEVFGGIVQNAFIASVPVLIAVGYEKDLVVHTVAATIKNIPYHFIDIGISTGHLMLEATALGLATCWIGWFHVKKARRLLALPSRIHLCGIISLGYPEHVERKERTRRDDVISWL